MRLEEDKEYWICDFCQSRHFPDPDADGVRVLGEPASLACPVCQVALVHAAAGGYRILWCNACRGMLIPMGVFVDLIGQLRARRKTGPEPAHLPNLEELKRQIDCPQCGAPMDTHAYAGPGNVIIDNCPPCHLNWLDYGELQRIIRAPYYDEDAWRRD